MVVVGQDGLVANVAKYLHGQPVLGVDPEPGVNVGVLVRHQVAAATTLLRGLGSDAEAPGGAPDRVAVLPVDALTMVRADLDDGQHLTALNEVFVGHPSHQSARYTLRCGAGEERQSSSGVLVATGTGATGWWASLAHDRGGRRAPGRTEHRLGWFVREAWPSPATGVSLTEGVVEEGPTSRSPSPRTGSSCSATAWRTTASSPRGARRSPSAPPTPRSASCAPDRFHPGDPSGPRGSMGSIAAVTGSP